MIKSNSDKNVYHSIYTLYVYVYCNLTILRTLSNIHKIAHKRIKVEKQRKRIYFEKIEHLAAAPYKSSAQAYWYATRITPTRTDVHRHQSWNTRVQKSALISTCFVVAHNHPTSFSARIDRLLTFESLFYTVNKFQIIYILRDF